MRIKIHMEYRLNNKDFIRWAVKFDEFLLVLFLHNKFFSRSQIATIKNGVLFGGVVNLIYLCK